MCKDVSLWGLKEGRILFNKDVLRAHKSAFLMNKPHSLIDRHSEIEFRGVSIIA